ncbi:ribonuclease H-like domain-containing protein [Tanacetum coccineum]
MQKRNPCRTPVDTESKLGDDGDPVSDHTLYRSLTGALQYLTFTRPDISYDVQQVCLYMNNPREPHLLTAYTDTDWAGCPVTLRSTSGYYVFLGDNLLSWPAKRQVTLSRSSAEAEYRGVANVVAETAWVRNLLRELHAPLFTVTLVYCDNVSAVYLSTNPVQHQRTKHIEIDIHFVHDFVAYGQWYMKVRAVALLKGRWFKVYGDYLRRRGVNYFPKIGLDTQIVVLWNPFLRKTVRIVVPRVSKKKVPDNSIVNVFYLRSGYSVVAFGVWPETNDVKLLMVNSSIPTRWVVKVFTLSSRAWRSLSFDPPFKSCDLSWDQVSLNGFIYLHGYDDCKLTIEIRSNLIASFDLKTKMFGQGGIGVWMIKDATTKSFTKIFTVKPCGPSVRRGLLGFRKNGEAILATLADLDDDDDTQGSSLLEVYDPCSG